MPTPRPLPDLPGVYYCRITGSYFGRPNGNIFTVRQTPAAATGSTDIATAATVAGALEGQWHNFATSALHNGYVAQEVHVYPLHTPTAPPAIISSTAVGGLTGNIMPLAMAKLIRHNVVRRGRGSQSRSSFSPILFTDVEGDGITMEPTANSVFGTAFNTLISSWLALCTSTAGGAWDYVQLGKGTALHPTPAVYAITSSAPETLASTVRRRTRRNG